MTFTTGPLPPYLPSFTGSGSGPSQGFVIFAAWYLKEPIRWNTVAGFAFVALGATLIFAPWSRPAGADPAAKPPAAPLGIEAGP